MTNTHTLWIFAGAWITLAVAIWFLGVSSWMSAATFWWLNAAVAAIGAVLVKTVRSAGPTRSIAHVLYDAEQRVRSAR